MSTATLSLGAMVDGGASQIEPSAIDVALLLDAAYGDGVEQPCSTHDPDLWFAESPADLELAKQLCSACPVRAACLAAALARREPCGVWGGEILLRGAVVPRKRPRGRPRKDQSR